MTAEATVTPHVVVGDDMPPELAIDVAEALARLGVTMELGGHAVRPTTTGRVILTISPKGGSGKTAIASNLAVELAKRHPGRVVAVDLDVQFGDLGPALSLQPERTLAHLAATSQLDATTVKLFLTHHESGLYVLAGAVDPADGDGVTAAHVAKILPLLARDFDFVVVDTAAGMDEHLLAASEQATDLLLLSSLDVTSLRSLRKAVEVFEQLGVTTPRRFVLNRADAKAGLTASDAREAIGLPIDVEVPVSRELQLALNLGRPVVESDRKSAAARAIGAVADLYAPSEAAKRWGRRR